MQALKTSGGSGRHRGLRIGVLTAFALSVIAFAAPAAMADPFPCTTAGYIVQNDADTGNDTWLQRVERQPDGTYDLVRLGVRPQADGNLNALAFRPQDGHMYAWDTANREIVRIGQDPTGAITFDPIGRPPGISLALGYFVATVLDDGRYLIWGAEAAPGTGEGGYIIDVTTTPAPTIVQTVTANFDTARFAFADWAVNPVDGKIYAPVADNNDLDPGGVREVREMILDRAAGTVSLGPVVGDGAPAGSAWFSPHEQGILFQYANVGFLYSTNIATGARTAHGPGPGAAGVDGAACAFTLAVTKDASPRTVATGSNELTYTYRVTNRSIGTNPIQFLDRLPAGMTYVPGGVNVSPPGVFTTSAYDNTDTLTIAGTMSHNGVATITARVKVAPGIACDREVRNQAQGTLSSPGLPAVTIDSDDPTTAQDPEDATAVRLTCGQSDLRLKKSGPSSYTPDGKISWTIKVKNRGPQASSGATVTDRAPKGVSDVGSPTKRCRVRGRKVTCKIGELAVGRSKTIKVTGTAPGNGGVLENTAEVDGKDPDPDPKNNRDRKRSRPRGAKVEVSKKASTGQAIQGEVVRWTLVARNVGRLDVPRARLCDQIPPGLTPLTLGGGELDDGELCWRFKPLRAGARKRVSFEARIDGDADPGNLRNTATLNGKGVRAKADESVAVSPAVAGGACRC